MTDAVERLRAWASQHSNVTPLDGTDRDSPTFGDLRELLALAAPSEKDAELIARLRTGAATLRGAAMFYDESRELDEAADRLATLTGPGENAGLERAAQWHDERYRDTPDAFEMEFHDVSRRTIRAMQSSSPPPKEATK